MTIQRLIIEKMPQGGFLVGDAACQPIFACTDIADALGFIGDKLAPVEKAYSADDKALAEEMAKELRVFAGCCEVCGSINPQSCHRQICPSRPFTPGTPAEYPMACSGERPADGSISF